MWASAVFKSLVQTGRLMVEDARGQRHVFGDGEAPRAGIRIKSRALERRIFFTPKLAIGEGYMDGELEIIEGDLYDFLNLCMANLGNLPQSRFHRWAETLRDKVALWQTFNPIHKAAGKVRHHYDLNGQLFDLFLDADRQYSCAYFKSPNDSLEQAQAQKKRRLAAKLHLADGHRVLDIGSGWGGLAMTLAGLRDVTVVGVTLSEEQYQHSRRRIDNAGLAERVRIHLQDYRQVQGHFDRIVSVGMLEHVGPRHYLEYYRKIAQLLTDNGVAVIHAIGKFHTPAPLNPWMAKYIFPGAYTDPGRTDEGHRKGRALGHRCGNPARALRRHSESLAPPLSAKHRHRARPLRRPLLPDVGFLPGRLRGGLPPRRVDGLSNSIGQSGRHAAANA